MTDPHEPQQGRDRPRKPTPARAQSGGAARPTPAHAGGGDGRRSGRRGRGRRGHRAPEGKPPSAREAAGETVAVSAVEPDAEAVEVDVDGERWTATLLGRSGAGGGRSTPLLLIGFSRVGDQAGASAHEALVSGRTLGGLSEADLLGALELSRAVSRG